MRRFARGRRRQPGEMNKLESSYAQLLDSYKSSQIVQWYAFEGIKLKLAAKTFFTPDFFLMNASGELECHEVKGFWEDDARVKIKCAAEKFPFKFVAVQFKKGQWLYEEF